MINLKDRKIIITGAASGIGRAIAIQAIKVGASVIAVDIDNAGLQSLEKETEKEKICTYTADVSKFNQVKHIFNNIQKYDAYPDCLINNAGIYYGKSIIKYNEDEIDKVLSVNIKSAIYCSKIFAQNKLRNKKQGSIINISSVSGHEGSTDAIYGLSKAALIGLTKSNAINFSPYVRVNAIAPGIVNTPMLKAIPKKRLNMYRENELITDTINPEDVANTVIFLISDVSKHYSGAVFDINNGCYLR